MKTAIPPPRAFDASSPDRRRQAAAAARRVRPPGLDAADVRQELLLRLHAEGRRFDPARGTPGQFAAAVLRTAAAALVRRSAARKRGAGVRTLPLAPGREPPARAAGGEAAVAVGEVLDRLPADLRRLALHLRDGGTVAELARGGDHRATWRRRLTRLRSAFAAAGFAPEGRP